MRRLLGDKRIGPCLEVVDPLESLEPESATLVSGVERTMLGAMLLPDAARFGPMYWACVERTRE